MTGAISKTKLLSCYPSTSLTIILDGALIESMKRFRTGNTTTSKVILELELVQSGHYMSIHLTEILLKEILGPIISLKHLVLNELVNCKIL